MRDTVALRMKNKALNEIDEKASEFSMNRSEMMRHCIFIGLEVLESEN